MHSHACDEVADSLIIREFGGGFVWGFGGGFGVGMGKGVAGVVENHPCAVGRQSQPGSAPRDPATLARGSALLWGSTSEGLVRSPKTKY